MFGHIVHLACVDLQSQVPTQVKFRLVFALQTATDKSNWTFCPPQHCGNLGKVKPWIDELTLVHTHLCQSSQLVVKIVKTAATCLSGQCVYLNDARSMFERVMPDSALRLGCPRARDLSNILAVVQPTEQRHFVHWSGMRPRWPGGFVFHMSSRCTNAFGIPHACGTETSARSCNMTMTFFSKPGLIQDLSGCHLLCNSSGPTSDSWARSQQPLISKPVGHMLGSCHDRAAKHWQEGLKFHHAGRAFFLPSGSLARQGSSFSGPLNGQEKMWQLCIKLLLQRQQPNSFPNMAVLLSVDGRATEPHWIFWSFCWSQNMWYGFGMLWLSVAAVSLGPLNLRCFLHTSGFGDHEFCPGSALSLESGNQHRLEQISFSTISSYQTIWRYFNSYSFESFLKMRLLGNIAKIQLASEQGTGPLTLPPNSPLQAFSVWVQSPVRISTKHFPGLHQR
jgi:hypothetical protein